MQTGQSGCDQSQPIKTRGSLLKFKKLNGTEIKVSGRHHLQRGQKEETLGKGSRPQRPDFSPGPYKPDAHSQAAPSRELAGLPGRGSGPLHRRGSSAPQAPGHGVPFRRSPQLATLAGPSAHPTRARAGTPLLGGRNRAPGPSHRKPPPPGARPAPPPAPRAARRPQPPRAARSPPSPQRPRHLPAAATPAAPNSAPLPPSSARTRAGSRERARSPDPEEAGRGGQVRTTYTRAASFRPYCGPGGKGALRPGLCPSGRRNWRPTGHQGL